MQITSFFDMQLLLNNSLLGKSFTNKNNIRILSQYIKQFFLGVIWLFFVQTTYFQNLN